MGLGLLPASMLDQVEGGAGMGRLARTAERGDELLEDRWLKEASGGRLDCGRKRADVCGPAADRGALVLGLMEWGRMRAMGVEDGCWKMGQMVTVGGGCTSRRSSPPAAMAAGLGEGDGAPYGCSGGAP
ncbi:hypothetical protein ACLOJK_013971 [Asimina triloba]